MWRSRNFLLLWSGQTVSEVGTQVSMIAVPLLAVQDLGASVFQVSLLSSLAWLPYLLFSLPAGVLADRVDQRGLMIVCDVVRFALMVSLPVVAVLGQLTFGYLCAVVGACGVLTVLFNVAYKSQLPRLVRPDQLVDGNAKLGISTNLAELVGPTISGALVGIIGAARTIAANGLAFLVSAVTLWLVRVPPAARPDDGEPREEVRLRAAMTEGLTFVLRHRILRDILACTTVSNFFVMAMGAVEVVFLLRDLHASSVVVGLVFTVSAVGGLAVGALTNRITAWVGSARVIWVSMTVPGPLYLLMPLAPPGWGVWLYAIGLAAFSGNVILYNAAATSYRQNVCPPDLLGRVNAAFLWICYGVIPLGALFGGALGTWIGLRGAIWVCAVGMWSACLFLLLSPLRRLKEMPVDLKHVVH